MDSHPLNPLDASWLLVESRDTPMHIAGLMPFSLPGDAGPGFMRELMADLRTPRGVVAPWSFRLQRPSLRHPIACWVEGDVDLEYHVRHSALPRPGGERELGQLVARLHSQPLDLARPPWEFHLIEGLAGKRFAIYVKMHHSLIDGISGVRLLMRSMAEDAAGSLGLPPFWAPDTVRRPAARRAPGQAPSFDALLGTLREGLGAQARSVPRIAGAFAAMARAVAGGKEAMTLPFAAPRSSLNGRVRGQRRVATQQVPIPRLRAIAQSAGGTLNDVVLSVCGGALRRFLVEDGTLPGRTLTAGVPVSVRPADDEGAGNAITFIVASLATDVDGARERLAAVVASTRRAKAHAQTLPRDAMTPYTMLLMAPSMVSMLTPLGGRVRPMFNVTVSNVPGPDKPLFFRGARLEAIYPISLISHGMALNITCESYAGTLNFAFVGCRDAVPHLQNLAVHAAEELVALEAALGITAAPGRAPRGTRTARGAAAASRKEAGAKAPPGTPAEPAVRAARRASRPAATGRGRRAAAV
jgi:WS/DGAT/MGAT family acyltransferase